MSINHFSADLQEPQWWSNPNSNSTHHHHHHQDNPRSHFAPQFYQNHHPPSWLNPQEPTTLNFNLNHNHDHAPVENAEFPDQLQHRRHQSPPRAAEADEEEEEEMEHMFEKPLTPSDVGKLNRLVIPKQHAEKYFPLGGGDSGLLLSFEDESGKSWRFRYSYWNSSQSYVLTKGWSRYVKEKRLDAGDVVLFERRRAHTDRLFIGWRRRSSSSSISNSTAGVAAAHDSGNSRAQVSGAGESSNGGVGWTRMFYSAPQQQYSSYPAHQLYQQQQAPYPPDCLHAAGSSGQNLGQTTTVGSSKILRLFGVNLECGQQQAGGADESEPSTPDGSSSLSMSSGHQQQQLFSRAYNYADHREDFSFSRDVNLMRNRRG